MCFFEPALYIACSVTIVEQNALSERIKDSYSGGDSEYIMWRQAAESYV